MKPRPTQFGVRENTASSRQHASCRAVHPPALNPNSVLRMSNRKALSPPGATSPDATLDPPLVEHRNGAAGERRGDDRQLLTVREVSKLLQVPVSWVYEHARPQCANPLPCMKVGKYLRFLSADIAKYLEGTRPTHHVSR